MFDADAGGEPLLKLEAGDVKALSIYGEGDARRIVSGGEDGVRVWDVVKGGEPLLKLDAGDVNALTWYGEGDARRIVSGGEEGLLLWDAVGGRRRCSSSRARGACARSRATARATGGTS